MIDILDTRESPHAGSRDEHAPIDAELVDAERDDVEDVERDDVEDVEEEDGFQDPASLAPLCGAEEYQELTAGVIEDSRPRLFAVFQDFGDRVDGRVAAWGIAFDDHAEVIGVDGGPRLNLRSPERAVARFTQKPQITARLVWL